VSQDSKFSGRVECRNSVQIRRQQHADLCGEARVEQTRDAIAPFSGPARLRPGEIVEAGAGMGVEDAERAWLAAQMRNDTRQRRMFDDVGEISRVKAVPVVHAAL
jgi:hypothetical protein